MPSKPKHYMGYAPEDFKTLHARFFNEELAPVPPSVKVALENLHSVQVQLPGLAQAKQLAEPGYQELENGFCLCPDGSIRVAILTPMPGVRPEMWDWWFGWHGSQDSRYKLWHPKAHRSAVWQDGRADVAYIGRVSMIEEYIGTKMERANIRFLHPEALGFEAAALEDKSKAVYICARVGYTHIPLDIGWLVHQVRSVEGGAEMRSRFWMGGQHVQIRSESWLAGQISKLVQKLARLPVQQAQDLMVHCSEEMNHLARFLPDLYAEMALDHKAD